MMSTAIDENELQLRMSNYFDIHGTGPDEVVVIREKGELSALLVAAGEGDLSLESVDTGFQDFLFDPHISRMSKLQVLWELFNEQQGDLAQYCFDVLASLKPIELTREFLKAYHEHSDPKQRTRIVNTLGEMLLVGTSSSLTPEQLNFIAAQSELIQQFLKDVARTAQDNSVRRAAVFLAPMALPADEAAQILDTLDHPPRSSENRDAIVTQAEAASLWIELALSSDDARRKYLPRAREMLQSAFGTADSDLKQRVTSMLSTVHLDPSEKQSLAPLLTDLRPPATGDSEYFQWVLASAAVLGNGPNDSDYVRKALNAGTPEEKTSIIIGGGDAFLSEMSAAEISSSADEIMSSFSKGAAEDEPTSYKLAALRRLAAYLPDSQQMNVEAFIEKHTPQIERHPSERDH